MPVKIPDDLPAKEILLRERVFVMGDERADSQDIRPLQIAILNLMPTKEVTELQLLRLLGNTALQVDITLLRPETYQPRHTSREHLTRFYTTFSCIKTRKFDGLVITGAPVEQMEFEDVAYWQELTDIMNWQRTHVTSTLFICWGAQAGLYHLYQVPKYPLPKKTFGVFPHTINDPSVPLLRGFDDLFYAPHSRHTEIRRGDIEHDTRLKVLSESTDAGVYIVMATNEREIFVTGHAEYDPRTLESEYQRDAQAGKPIELPANYYPHDNPKRPPLVLWRSHASLLFGNWLNYYVYQTTPFDLEMIR